MAAATAAVAERRKPAAAGAAVADSVDGVYAWADAEASKGLMRPAAGGKAMLVYNCSSGPLGFTKSAKLHLGFDSWHRQEKKVGGALSGAPWGAGGCGAGAEP